MRQCHVLMGFRTFRLHATALPNLLLALCHPPPRSLDGAFDIRPAIEAAASGVMLSAKQLEVCGASGVY